MPNIYHGILLKCKLFRYIINSQNRTLFIRSTIDVKKNQDLLLLMYLFGLKTLYVDFKEKILHELL